MTVDVKLNVSEEVMAYLRREAERRKVALDEVVSEVLADYVEVTSSEPTDDEILAGLRVGMQQALAGDYRPAREVLDEIDREMSDDAD
jgi:predicted transcriptional regulator